MAKPNGFITLHRKLLTSSVFDDAELLKMWVWCLLRANHKDTEAVHANQIISLKRGQFVTGRFTASQELNITPQKLRSRLEILVRLRQIGIKSTNKYSIITVVNYDFYQTNEKDLTNKQPTNNQQITTDNNVNNENNISGANAPVDIPLKDKNNTMGGFDKTGDDFLEEDVQLEPDYKPKGKKRPDSLRKITPQARLVFDLFGPDCYKRIGVRKQEADASLFLAEAHDFETLQKAVLYLKENSDNEFLPQILSPYDLRMKWAKLKDFKEKHG